MMNILYVSSDPREEATLRQELQPFSPVIGIHPSPGIEDARKRIGVAGAFDVLLIDASIPHPEAASLVEALKRERNPAGIVVLTSETDDDAARAQFQGGVDRFIPRRPEFGAVLHPALLQATARQSADPAHQGRRVRIRYAGDLDDFRRHFAHIPFLLIDALPPGADGTPQPAEAGPGDLAVIDCSGDRALAVKVIENAVLGDPEMPVIALTEPGSEAAAIAALNAGAADCIPKDDAFPRRLLAAVERAIRIRQLTHEKEALKRRGERLRIIVETLPVGVALIAPDGAFLAVNRTGLELIGAHRSDQVIGKNLLQLVPREEREGVQQFLASVGAWSSASLSLTWKGIDGSIPGVEVRAIPMRRDPGSAASALATLHPPQAREGDAGAEEAIRNRYDELTQMLRTYEVRFRELQEKSNFKLSRWETALGQAESQKKAAEERQVRLMEAVDAADARWKQLAEEHNAERARWEESNQGLREQSARLEAAAAALRSPQAQLLERQGADGGGLEEERQDFERRLAAAEAALAEVSGLLEKEKARHEQQQEEMEQRFREAESRKSELEAALQETGARLQQQAEAYRAELAARDESRGAIEQELEETRAARAALEAAEAACAELDARFKDETGRLDSEISRLKLAEQHLVEQLAETEARLHDQDEAHRAELAARDESRGTLEQKLRETENSWLALEAALEETEARLTGLTTTHRQLEERYRAADGGRESLQSALRLQAAQFAALCEKSGAGRAWQELSKIELERNHQAAEGQRALLEAALRDAELRIGELTEKYIAERRAQELREQELRMRQQAAETRIRDLEAARAEWESRAQELATAHDAERAELEQSLGAGEARYREAESRMEPLERELREAGARLAALAISHASEQVRLNTLIGELESKYQAAERQRISLQTALADSESRAAGMKERHDVELQQWGSARGELELRIREAEQQRAHQQLALAGAETTLAQLAEKHRTEISQYEFAQKKAEQKFQAAEKQRGALQASLQEVEARLAEVTGKYNVEQAGWQAAGAEMDRRLQEAEKAHAAALHNAVREAESRLAWISEQNQSKAVQLERVEKQLEELQSENRSLALEGARYRGSYQRLSRFTAAGIVRATLEGRVVECNDIAAQMFGYPNAEAALAQPDGRPFQIYSFTGELAARLDEEGKLRNIEWASLGNEGRLIRIQEHAALLEAPAGETPLVERILTDITRTHGVGEEIRRAQSAGELAAATVESFKDLCASLAEAGERIRQAAGDADGVRRLADSLSGDASRGSRHAGQFLSIARKTERPPELLDLNEVLTGNDALLHSLIGSDIDLELNLAPRLGLVRADRNEVIRLIGNLMANAREALPLGGGVTIETRDIEVAGPAPEYPSELRPGIYVRLIFATDGCAVQPERRTASIRTIAARMGGCLETSNDTRLGNLHKVYIPRVEGAPVRAERHAGFMGA